MEMSGNLARTCQNKNQVIHVPTERKLLATNYTTLACFQNVGRRNSTNLPRSPGSKVFEPSVLPGELSSYGFLSKAESCKASGPRFFLQQVSCHDISKDDRWKMLEDTCCPLALLAVNDSAFVDQ